MVRVTIDGVTGEVGSHLTILRAAKSFGVEIPTLCSDKHLEPFGACRICVVEVEGQKKLVAACTTSVMNNMVIQTKSAKVMKARKNNLELILARHPLDCLVCEKGGECDLQKVSFELGLTDKDIATSNRFVDIFGPTPIDVAIDDDRAVLERDLNKCILCKKCVRICDEVQGADAITFARRGPGMSLGTFYGNALDCDFCGQCVDVCPVGALFSRLNKYKARPWQIRNVASVCPYCAVGCSVNLGFKGDNLVKVTGRDTGINSSFLCVKGRYGFDFISDKSRLTSPLIRKNDTLAVAEWDDAIDCVSEKLREIVSKYGPDSVYGVGSARCTNEENYLFQKFMRTSIGTNNVDSCVRFEHAAALEVMSQRLGFMAGTNGTEELEGTEVILLIGCNVTETHPILGIKVNSAVRKHGAKLVVVEPRKTRASKFAHMTVPLKPGSDLAFINGMISVILDEKLYSTAFIEENVAMFEEFKNAASDFSLKEAAEVCGIDESVIRDTALLYASASSAVILFGMGLTQHKNVDANIDALINLPLLTGHIGKKHSGLIPVRGQNNIQGCCDMGVLPNYMPGYVGLDDESALKSLEEKWEAKLPRIPGLALSELTDAILDGKIKALYIMGENPLMSSPNTPRVKKALSSLELLVVQDMFLSETAEVADIVLPAASFAEKDGTYTNMDRKVQRIRRGVHPHGNSKADWEILLLLMNSMGGKEKYWHPSEIMREVREVVPFYAGVSYVGLGQSPIQWPTLEKGEKSEGFIRKFGNDLRFKYITYGAEKALTSDDYPFLLLTGKNLFHYHTGTMTRRSNDLMEISGCGVLEIHPKDAEELLLKAEDRVKVTSSSGEIEVLIKITDHSPEGTLFTTVHFRESAVSNLVDDSYAGVGKTPNLKMCAVNIQKLG